MTPPPFFPKSEPQKGVGKRGGISGFKGTAKAKKETNEPKEIMYNAKQSLLGLFVQGGKRHKSDGFGLYKVQLGHKQRKFQESASDKGNVEMLHD